MQDPITSFSGPYHFLSNFYPRSFEYNGRFGLSAEHHFQAAKALSKDERDWVYEAPTSAAAKRAGRRVFKRPDWDDVKVAVMEEILAAKFKDSIPRKLLLLTGEWELVEGNTWGDTFWGVCNGEGQNWLGKCLMKVRDDLRRL